MLRNENEDGSDSRPECSLVVLSWPLLSEIKLNPVSSGNDDSVLSGDAINEKAENAEESDCFVFGTPLFKFIPPNIEESRQRKVIIVHRSIIMLYASVTKYLYFSFQKEFLWRNSSRNQTLT